MNSIKKCFNIAFVSPKRPTGQSLVDLRGDSLRQPKQPQNYGKVRLPAAARSGNSQGQRSGVESAHHTHA